VDVFKNEFKKSLKVVGKTARKILQPREGKSGVTAERILFAIRLRTQIRDEGVGGKEADCRRGRKAARRLEAPVQKDAKDGVAGHLAGYQSTRRNGSVGW
jgi:hypothetical protein